MKYADIIINTYCRYCDMQLAT